ncbi:MAG TPA: DUF445 domain-containing protein [Acidimicrobiales bacterium]|nr:DUF445 domain-containing protein [Acidimicrobiales bacterium]
MTTAAPPVAAGEVARRARLATMRRRATALLVAVTLIFLVLVLAGGEATWVGYARAAIEASMVGALADWFAVTALFRHPLGVPIPHTAIIPERKDQFGETLGDFVQSSFLTPEIIVERVRTARVSARLAAWMATPDNAERLAGHMADAAVTFADVVRDEEVQRAIEEAVRRRVESVPLAPLAGRTLGLLTEGGRHQQLLDAMLHTLDKYLDGNHDRLRARFAAETPWWMPEAVEERLFVRLIEIARQVVHDVAEDPDHELRREADVRVRNMVDELQTSEAMRRRGEELKGELLDHPELRRWVATIWEDVKESLRAQAADPGSELRRRLAETVVSLGRRLQEDPALAERVDEAVETGVRYVAEHFHDEIAAMVSGTISRWDGRETADRLELLLGPDLQFIRINGTVVGGLAGLVIYSVAQVIG